MDCSAARVSSPFGNFIINAAELPDNWTFDKQGYPIIAQHKYTSIPHLLTSLFQSIRPAIYSSRVNFAWSNIYVENFLQIFYYLLLFFLFLIYSKFSHENLDSYDILARFLIILLPFLIVRTNQFRPGKRPGGKRPGWTY